MQFDPPTSKTSCIEVYYYFAALAVDYFEAYIQAVQAMPQTMYSIVAEFANYLCVKSKFFFRIHIDM